MTSRNQILLFSIVLIITSIALMSYKVKVLNFPIFQEETTNIWNIEAKISFDSKKNQSALVSMILPKKQDGIIIVNEESSSADYGFTKRKLNSTNKGVWSKREIEGSQVIYYSIDIIKDKYYKANLEAEPIEVETMEVPSVMVQAANSLLNKIYDKSSDSLTFTSLLIKEFNLVQPSQAAKMIKNNYMKTAKEKRDALVQLLNKMQYKVRTIGALYLEDKQRNIVLTPMLEVFHKDKWYLFDINNGLIENSSEIFIWQRGSQFLLEAEGVKNSNVRFSVTKNIVPARNAALSKDLKNQSTLLDFSLFTLPNESQNTFKLLLLVPLGALVVVIMRVIVGLKTSGTFMPILLSMAFIETSLIPGIMMFILVVTMGLIVRSYLSHLNLLLVARISSVLIVVVGIMAFVAILSHKLELEYATSITFFPIIILAWTIERMSIIWEEDGSKEVFLQGSGSLIVSIIAYFAMTNSVLSFITFNFPEVLLAVLGLIILLGRYSGYRLSELYRFKSMVK
ncbi:MAG: inactive transglutaminase family protein [Halarcobacter ebronensis]|uniref:inactive transglutaminase family protein n=1 Tax=Halarcobacter ebronensis TaxID=1462615 RepID=UPI003C74911F